MAKRGNMPWNKGLKNIYTEETLKKMSEARKGRPSYWTGKHRSEETRRKLRLANLGHKHTEESRRKMSESRKGKSHWSEERKKKLSEKRMGNKNPFFGKRHTEETRIKISEAGKGRPGYWAGKQFSKETRRKLSEMRKGDKNQFWGKHHTEETRRKISEAHKGKHPSEETKRKLSESLKGRHRPPFSEEHKLKISMTKKGSVPWNRGKKGVQIAWNKGVKGVQIAWNKGLTGIFTEEALNKNREVHRGKHPTEETRKKMSLANKRLFFGKHHTEEARKKISEANIRAKKSGKYNIKPTAPEKKLTEICSKHNLPYEYVGDGKYWVEKVNPDFVNCDGKKVCIEVFGDYWHKRSDQKIKDEKNLTILKKHGWQRIVVWESELKRLPEAEIVRRVLDQTKPVITPS